jgi:ABC-type transport system substrate-binding protein
MSRTQPTRRQALAALAAASLARPALAAAPDAAAAPQKILRSAFLIAETGFDPAQVSDLYSRTIIGAIFEAPLEFEFLARPYKLRPNTLAEMPVVEDDFKTYTFRVKPGIRFADDPAFGGKPRELVAEDFVYSLKRHYDPRWKSPNLYILENVKVLGLSELRRELQAAKKPFDYERPVEGLRAIDRYTWQIRLGISEPRFLAILTDIAWASVAREVVEFYGDRIMEHPVGTGAFKLGEWRRASRIVLDRNPLYREVLYNETAPPGDAMAQAAVAKLQGKRMPFVDRIEVAIIEESQPRLLAFLNGEHDLFDGVPAEFANLVMPKGRLAPNLAKRNIQMRRYLRADVTVSYFNIEDPIVGGYTPDKVALRRAISLAVDVDKEIRLVRRDQAIPAQGLIGPETWGYDPALRSEMGEFNPGKAKALLDLYGYLDRDGDGWREMPDGRPLVLEYSTQPDQQSRQLVEQWQKNMNAIGLQIVFKTAKWPENLKGANAGKLMMWGVGWVATMPDGDVFLALGYGPNKGQANKSRFDLPAFNQAYARQKGLANGPERSAAMAEATKIAVAYMPYKVHVHRIFTDLAQPWVIGYHRNVFAGIAAGWRAVDIDTAMQKPSAA